MDHKCRENDDDENCIDSHYCPRCGAHLFDDIEKLCGTCVGELRLKWQYEPHKIPREYRDLLERTLESTYPEWKGMLY